MGRVKYVLLFKLFHKKYCILIYFLNGNNKIPYVDYRPAHKRAYREAKTHV
jgi:hypothetical protein